MLKDGLAYLAHHSTLRTLALAVGMINTVTGGVFAVLVLYATHALHHPVAPTVGSSPPSHSVA